MTTRYVAAAAALVAVLAAARADSDPLAVLLLRTDAVAKEVVKLRGLKLKRPLEREVIDRAELRRRLLALAEEEAAQAATRAEGLALARWGLIPLDTNYLQLMIDLLTDGVAGYYDAKTKKLTISKQAAHDPAWAELVLAHEIDHALQDRAFDLTRLMTVAPTEGDAALARRALIEGDAVALMIELALSRQGLEPPWADPSVASTVKGAMGLPPDDVLDRAPLVVRESMLFPYRSGFAFVARVRQDETWSAVDAVFRRPPRSTEQIIHHDKYVADERPIGVALAAPALLADFTIAHSTVWGELGFSLFLRAHGIPAETAAQAAEGWGGDRVLVLARVGDVRASRAIGVARFAWDSEADAIEAHEAAVRALDATLLGATAEHGDTRTRWLAVDGTVTYAERRGSELALGLGIPVPLASSALIDELWAPRPTR